MIFGFIQSSISICKPVNFFHRVWQSIDLQTGLLWYLYCLRGNWILREYLEQRMQQQIQMESVELTVSVERVEELVQGVGRGVEGEE